MKTTHAFLITGGDAQTRQEKAQTMVLNYQGSLSTDLNQNLDILILQEKDSIKISQIRELKKKLQLKPYYQKFKISIILQAEKMTIAAQNALLKTLEEPPLHSIIILTTNQPELLLPTIHSRVWTINLPPAKDNRLSDQILVETAKITTRILSLKLGDRVKLAQNYANSSQEALIFTTNQLALWRRWLILKTREPKIKNISMKIDLPTIIKIIKNIQKTYIYLNHQVNPRLALEDLLMNYPKINLT